MIHPIDIRDADIAARILRLQRASYAVEAQLIGFDQIPTLLDRVESLQRCGEVFHARWIEDDIAGAVSFTRAGDEVTICRLMVHPDHFRRGIARELLQRAMAENADARVFEVATGTLNTPAVNLYRSIGFQESARREVAPSVFLTFFSKRMRP